MFDNKIQSPYTVAKYLYFDRYGWIDDYLDYNEVIRYLHIYGCVKR